MVTGTAAQHWAFGTGRMTCCGVEGTAPGVGLGPFPRGRWLHSPSEIKGKEGHSNDKWQFLRITCIWLFLLKFQYGPICYSWNSLQSKQYSCIKGTALSWETSKFSVLFPQSAISSWKYPSLGQIWNTSPWSFLGSEVYTPEAKHHWGFQSCFEDKVQSSLFSFAWITCFYAPKSHVIDSPDLFQEFGLASYGSKIGNQMFPLVFILGW